MEGEYRQNRCEKKRINCGTGREILSGLLEKKFKTG
jgi:hypothetical protein